MAVLLEPTTIKNINLKNKLVMSPMCQYQAEDGIPNDWHFVHYVSRAIGGVGLIIFEMTDIEPRGRITEGCLGLWSENQVQHFSRIIDECHLYGSKIGIQLAHAGRKSNIKDGDIVAPSSIAFSENSPVPRELSKQEIEEIIKKFGVSTKLAIQAGVNVIELHGAHGYLLHQFLSPFSNKREDEYGENKKFPLEVIKEVKKNMPTEIPLIMRISACEYDSGGYDFNHILDVIPEFIEAGVDIFDVSTGGNGPTRPNTYPAFQVSYAHTIKQKFNVPVISVGRFEDALVAEAVLAKQQADLVAVGKGLLKNPYWLKESAVKLNHDYNLPGVYDKGFLV